MICLTRTLRASVSRTLYLFIQIIHLIDRLSICHIKHYKSLVKAYINYTLVSKLPYHHLVSAPLIFKASCFINKSKVSFP